MTWDDGAIRLYGWRGGSVVDTSGRVLSSDRNQHRAPRVGTGKSNGGDHVWIDRTGGRMTFPVPDGVVGITEIQQSSSGSTVAASFDGGLLIWTRAGSTPHRVDLANRAREIDVSPDGRQVLVHEEAPSPRAGKAERILVLDASNPKVPLPLPDVGLDDGRITYRGKTEELMAFSPDGKWLFTSVQVDPSLVDH